MVGSNENELRRRNHELSILNTIAQTLNSSVDLPQALHGVLVQVADLLDLQTGWVWLLQDETGKSYLAATQSLPPALANNPAQMEGSCYCLRTFRAGDLEGAANVNVVECSRLEGLVDGTDGLRYHASIPLYASGKKLGVLNVASTDWRRLAPDDLRLLHTIGDMLGIAVERAQLFARSAQVGAVEERNRLAREIHDTLAQGLTAVSLRLESADVLLEAGADAERVRQVVQSALDLTRTNLEEARRSVLDLRAAPLAGRTLVQALQELAQRCAVPATVQVTGGERPLPPRIEITLYRVAQEALHNVVQHARASRAMLTLHILPEQALLTITDDGVGFDPGSVPGQRFGLIGMNERVKLSGGTLVLESGHGAGTSVQARLPLQNRSWHNDE